MGITEIHYYSIRDVVASDFADIFPARTDAQALRAFTARLKSDEKLNPEDYQLWSVGVFSFDDKNSTPAFKSMIYEIKEGGVKE